MLVAAPTGDDNGRLGEPEWSKTNRGYAPHDQPMELFNLRQDLSEQRNVSADNLGLVAEMAELLKKYVADGRSSPGPRQLHDVPVIVDKPNR